MTRITRFPRRDSLSCPSCFPASVWTKLLIGGAGHHHSHPPAPCTNFRRFGIVTMAKALDGLSIVEFSSHLGAAYAAMLLAEQGADVIRLESPSSSGRGTPHYHVLNRSKRI